MLDTTHTTVSNLKMKLSTLSDKVNSTSILRMKITTTRMTRTTRITETSRMIMTRALNHEVMW